MIIMIKLLLLTIFTLGAYWTYGQVCGTPHPVNPTTYSTSPGAREAHPSSFCINVFFHIVRNTNGTNAFTLPNTDAIVRKLNEFYSRHNIIVNNAGTAFINNSNFVNIGSRSEARTLGQTNNRSDAINYYIVETLWRTRDGYVVAGTADSIPSNSLVMGEDRRVNTNSRSHELGTLPEFISYTSYCLGH